MNATVQKKKLHAKFGCGATVVKITNTTAIKVVWRTTSQHDKTRLAAFGTWLFTLRLVRAHQHVSYHNNVLLRETGVLGPCNTEPVEISWLVGWSQSVSIYCPCEQQTLNKKLFTGAHKKHLKFILLFFFSCSDPFSRNISIHQTEAVLEHGAAEAPLQQMQLRGSAPRQRCAVSHRKDSWKAQLNGGRTWNVSAWGSPSCLTRSLRSSSDISPKGEDLENHKSQALFAKCAFSLCCMFFVFFLLLNYYMCLPLWVTHIYCIYVFF